ncbi:hypothetical protein Pmani_032304 [Petrolisthes manimaculis]|uniref:Uncharacterized protein n=1 Tax=Petrolisthes manimaculis TaxID=1843537 RepID=A0AAE1NTC8_9EUCA|nr:hypothetical protein Pmani_032304 [Petrolisthes manimaculis]
MDRLTLTQAGSSYGQTHSHSSWQLLWTHSLSLKLAALMDRLKGIWLLMEFEQQQQLPQQQQQLPQQQQQQLPQQQQLSIYDV